jgi:hypothetical protein
MDINHRPKEFNFGRTDFLNRQIPAHEAEYVSGNKWELKETGKCAGGAILARLMQRSCLVQKTIEVERHQVNCGR